MQLGVQGYYLKQATDHLQKGISAGNRGNQGQAVGIGPQLVYHFAPHAGVVLKYGASSVSEIARAVTGCSWRQAFRSELHGVYETLDDPIVGDARLVTGSAFECSTIISLTSCEGTPCGRAACTHTSPRRF
jgi:Putative MetA-pathway of phenol degradation